MSAFSFLGDFDSSPLSGLSNFWRLENHDVPDAPGVYFLVAKPGVRVTYPTGTSPIYYIGQASSLRNRLLGHLDFTTHVRENRRTTSPLYWRVYEYGGVHGGRYCYMRTWRGVTPKALEDIVLARFAKRYRAFPVANNAGAWNRVTWKNAQSVRRTV